VPSHVGIPGNECADKAAEAGRKRVPAPKWAPDFDGVYGISYGAAKSSINRAVRRVTQQQWDRTNTTLKQYKPIMQETPYTDLGNPSTIRIRHGFKLGADFLNYTRHKFSEKPEDRWCPCCPWRDETVHHFVMECELYKEPRMQLLEKWWEVYGLHETNRIWSVKGLLEEPTTPEGIAKHAPMIEGFNHFIERACTIRTQCQDWNEYENAFEE
jgi:hypothetical protein